MTKLHLVKLIVLFLSISCPSPLKLVAASSEVSASATLDGAQDNQAGSSMLSQAMDMASNVPMQQQGQQLFTPSNLLEFGLNPVGSAMKYIMPNTYQGMSSDLSKGITMLTNGASQGLGSAQSQFGSLSDQLSNRYNAMLQNYSNRQQQLYQQQEALLGRMHDILANPEQFCRQLSDRTNSMGQQSGQQANQVLNQANQQFSSFMNKLSSSFPVFG